jgi:hypothetical protein
MIFTNNLSNDSLAPIKYDFNKKAITSGLSEM